VTPASPNPHGSISGHVGISVVVDTVVVESLVVEIVESITVEVESVIVEVDSVDVSVDVGLMLVVDIGDVVEEEVSGVVIVVVVIMQ
jgi:hypothetical protein